MKNETYKSLGLNVVISVPESVEEYDKLAGKDGAALADATVNTVYRSVLNVFRAQIADAVEKQSGVARKRTYKVDANGAQVLDDEQNPIIETEEPEAKYISRVAGDNVEQFQTLADEIATKLIFDPKVKERAAFAPKKLAQKFIDAATQIITAGHGEAVASALSAKLAIAVDGTSAESLGSAIRLDQTKKSLVGEYVS